jgi:hypothetical protein
VGHHHRQPHRGCGIFCNEIALRGAICVWCKSMLWGIYDVLSERSSCELHTCCTMSSSDIILNNSGAPDAYMSAVHPSFRTVSAEIQGQQFMAFS